MFWGYRKTAHYVPCDHHVTILFCFDCSCTCIMYFCCCYKIKIKFDLLPRLAGSRRGRPAASCCHLVPKCSSTATLGRSDTTSQRPGRRRSWPRNVTFRQIITVYLPVLNTSHKHDLKHDQSAFAGIFMFHKYCIL